MGDMKKRIDIYLPETAIRIGENVVILQEQKMIVVMDLINTPYPFKYPSRTIDLRYEK